MESLSSKSSRRLQQKTRGRKVGSGWRNGSNTTGPQPVTSKFNGFLVGQKKTREKDSGELVAGAEEEGGGERREGGGILIAVLYW